MTIIGYLILKLTRVGINIERDELCASISHNWEKAKHDMQKSTEYSVRTNFSALSSVHPYTLTNLG